LKNETPNSGPPAKPEQRGQMQISSIPLRFWQLFTRWMTPTLTGVTERYEKKEIRRRASRKVTGKKN
jgi:hypothetical protein